MSAMPDGNAVAERQYAHEQGELEKEFLLTAADRATEARDRIHDAETLKQILDDEELAPWLAEAFANLEAAGQEAFGKRLPAVEMILRCVARLERQCFDWQLHKLERDL